MIPAIIPKRLAIAALLTALPLFSGFREDIGFPGLHAEFGGSIPNGSSLKIAHIEYVRDGTWAPQAVNELQGKAITYSPGIPSSFSYHGDEVGRVFYGSTSSIIPAAFQITAFEAWNYFDSSLHTAKGVAPAIADWDVENHSYISNSGLTVNEGGRRLDYRIDRDGVTAVVVLENGTGTIPPLFGNTFNTIVVGSSTGNHSRGGTNRDTSGRLKPDIVGTATWTSYAGPIVGSAAGLLIAQAKTDPNLASARRPEAVKAILMAGATKDEFPSWTRSASVPLDPVYGAGEVNIHNSYRILISGRQPASASAVRSNRGWDLNSVGSGSSLRYFFTIGSGQTGTLSAALTWHRRIEPNNGQWNMGVTSSLDNLDLRLYRANGSFQLGDLLQDSISTLDNVEHIYLRNLTEGTYALQVTSVSGSRQFGLAWSVFGSPSDGGSLPPTVVAPSITLQPSPGTVEEGSSTTLNVTTSGSDPIAYQWTKDGVAIPGATSASLTIASAALSDAGTYSVTVSNSAGSVTSQGAYLTVTAAVSLPVITVQPRSASVSEGSGVLFSVMASGSDSISYQWRRNGTPILGATAAAFTIMSAQTSDAASYSVVVSNTAGSVTSVDAVLAVSESSQVMAGARLSNISSRSKVGTGSAILISGFVVTGSEPKTLLIRAAGPSLGGLGVEGSLQRPRVSVYAGSTVIQEVGAGGRFPGIEETRLASSVAGAFAFPDSSSDVAIVRAFQPGAYTVHLTGENNSTGIALIEVYDLDASGSGSRVVNLSTRAEVKQGGEILIAGVYVSGKSPKQLLIRAVGPGLTELGVPGVLATPKIALYQGNTVIAENTGWTSASNAGEINPVSARVGAFALEESNSDSALLVTLPPGGYTLHISGADGGTGIVLVDLFEVP